MFLHTARIWHEDHVIFVHLYLCTPLILHIFLLVLRVNLQVVKVVPEGMVIHTLKGLLIAKVLGERIGSGLLAQDIQPEGSLATSHCFVYNDRRRWRTYHGTDIHS